MLHIKNYQDSEPTRAMLRCSHKTIDCHSEYWRIFQCAHCGIYLVCVKETKNKFYWEVAHIKHSDNDDRITNIWFPSIEKFGYVMFS